MLAVTRLSETRFHSLRNEPGFALSEGAVFRIEGPGALDCLQGVLTCDLAAPGPGSAQYGAVLTPKGMIVADFHVLRDGDGFTLVTSREARDTSLAQFRRQFPPRLARITDRSESDRVLWMLGPRAHEVARASGVPWPAEPGRMTEFTIADEIARASRPHPQAPWPAFIVAGSPAGESLAAAMGSAGARRWTALELEAARILAGWPGLGLEIDSKTLPQEVRYEELGGVSYTKGCYVGQETVARIHFRGHVNRVLRGLTWEGEAPEQPGITAGNKSVGQLSSALQVDSRGYGLALIRREAEPGTTVEIGATPAAVVRLPFPEPAAAA